MTSRPIEDITRLADELVTAASREPITRERDNLLAAYRRVDDLITAHAWPEPDIDALAHHLRGRLNVRDRDDLTNPAALAAHRIHVHWLDLVAAQQQHRAALQARSHPNLRWDSDDLDERHADVVVNHRRIGSIELLDEADVPPRADGGRWLALTLHTEAIADPQWNASAPVLRTPQEAAEAVMQPVR